MNTQSPGVSPDTCAEQCAAHGINRQKSVNRVIAAQDGQVALPIVPRFPANIVFNKVVWPAVVFTPQCTSENQIKKPHHALPFIDLGQLLIKI